MASEYRNIKSNKIAQSEDSSPEAVGSCKPSWICEQCIEITFNNRTVNIGHYFNIS